VNPVRVLLVTHTAAVADRIRAVLRPVADVDLCSEALPVGGLGSARASNPHLVLLELDPADPTGPKLVTGLLAEPGLLVLALWPARSRPMPEALTRGLGAGRLEIMRPPLEGSGERAERWDRALVDTIRSMAQSRWTALSPADSRCLAPRPGRIAVPRMIGIAASTGGPQALARIVGELPAQLPVPLLLAQHMTPGFVTGLVDWLSKVTALQVVVATEGTIPRAGHLYIPPDECDIEVGPERGLRIRPGKGPHCPSADALLRSLASVLGAEAAGVVLTGMGNDGAQGLLAIARAGGITIAQDEASSVVFGMPKAAIAAGAVSRVLSLDSMAAAIRQLASGAAPEGSTLQLAPGSIDTEPR
jgi:two-component system chemotaxis response regulator CheB